MPTVAVDAEHLYERLKGRIRHELPEQYTLGLVEKIITDLAFQFGLEVDGVESVNGRDRLKFDIPANRYDLLCLEGIADALTRFDTNQSPSPPVGGQPSVCAGEVCATGPRIALRVGASTFPLRPFVVACVFRDVHFDESSYARFIELQDKLHLTLARRRTLVSMGTHDLDKLAPPLRYECLPRKNGFHFVPLKHTESVDGEGMFALLEHSYLKPYLPIISHSDVCPVILDSQDRVASLPPIINSEFSKMSVDTRNVFVEITAVDNHKAEIVLDQICAFMADKTAIKSEVERVEIIYDKKHPGAKLDFKATTEQCVHTVATPRLNKLIFSVKPSYIRRVLGLPQITNTEIESSLAKMGLTVANEKPSGLGDGDASEETMRVECPITRRDILHPCDIAEDVGIAWGFSAIPYERFGCASAQPVQMLSEKLRRLCAQALWRECLTFALVSRSDAYEGLMRNPPPCHSHTAVAGPGVCGPGVCGTEDVAGRFYSSLSVPVEVAEPKTKEFEILRPTLISGLLHTLASNQASQLPIRLFEIGDTVSFVEDEAHQLTLRQEGRHTAGARDTGVYHKRTLCALIADEQGSRLEDVHGLLDLLLQRLGLRPVYADSPGKARRYWLEEGQEKMFLPHRSVDVMVAQDETSDPGIRSPHAQRLGVMGVLHPDVLKYFGIPFPCSLFEISIEPILHWQDEVAASMT